ncbi:MAG: DUF4270 domain-containing protein [Bacteroidales bacterium]|nr:DUF4270 domain-containing protein [Bacteroidales bacterium]
MNVKTVNSFFILIAAGILLLSSFFLSCKKDPQTLGYDLVENNPLEVVFCDTVTVVAYSEVEDSVRTDETTYSLLGSLYDPVFGKTSASVFTQISLSSTNPDFGTNPQCDSLVFSLQYTGYYGDTTTVQTIRLYEITESLFLDSTYYSSHMVAYDAVELASYTFAPHPNDSVLIDTTYYEPHLRFTMPPALGNKILTAPSTALDSISSFKEYFKGLAILPDDVATGPGMGSLLYFNFYANISRINLYYHNDEKDSLSYRIALNATSNARFVHFDHYGYQQADDLFRQQILLGDTALGNSLLYLQSTSGVKTRIEFPYLMNLVGDNNIAINEAQLIVYNQDPQSVYPPPQELALYGTNDSTLFYLPDQSEDADYFDGKYNEPRYRFRISRYIQETLLGDQSNIGLYLFTTGASINANRVVLYGTGTSGNRMKLRLIYTRPNI